MRNSLKDGWSTHYSKLYAQDLHEHPGMEAVLPSVRLFADLDEEPTEDKLSEAIIALSNVMELGKDGIPAEILKEHKDVLLPHLHALLLQCWRQREIPHKLRDAKIVSRYSRVHNAPCLCFTVSVLPCLCLCSTIYLTLSVLYCVLCLTAPVIRISVFHGVYIPLSLIFTLSVFHGVC